jgi:endoglucanase
VVNGGLSVYLLLNTFERTKSARSADWGALGDGSLRIPEANNRIPDVLDEVRHELEFLLAMQVPDGQPLAGMVHHKVHDNEWTWLPQMPHTDPKVRWLHRPSTAATLNLAAAAAQAARLYAPYDRAFAGRLLRASQRAWVAAREHRPLYAPLADGYKGGGAYEDEDVSDEFYWAAAELYLTTGSDLYRNFLLASPHHAGPVFIPEGFAWDRVAALGRLDLATVPSLLPGRAAVIQSVVDAGRAYRADEAANGFGQPYLPRDGVYVWGSNAQVLNNLVVLGTAYDLSGDLSLGDAVAEGVDYLLGRNALNISFVTGYGTVFSENEHSRIYAHQLDPSLPRPPIGTITAGPDSQTKWWDSIIWLLFGKQHCPPQFCYVDDIMSGSTNELTLNLNAPLAWVASFLADQNAGRPQAPRCTVDWHYLKTDVGRLHVTLRNDSPLPLVGNALSWAFFGDQSVEKVVVPAGAVVNQAGATVTIRPFLGKPWKLGPSDTVAFELTVDRGRLASPEPGTFYLNGQACRSR